MIISKRGIKVDHDKSELILKFPNPFTLKEVHQFLGHAKFYKICIKDFSKAAQPLCALLLREVKFKWSNGCQKTFDTLMEKLTFTPT